MKICGAAPHFYAECERGALDIEPGRAGRAGHVANVGRILALCAGQTCIRLDTGCGFTPHYRAMDIDRITKGRGVAAKLAKQLGLHRTSVLGWRQVPVRHVRKVSEITGIPMHTLRPDVYASPSEAQAA